MLFANVRNMRINRKFIITKQLEISTWNILTCIHVFGN